MLYDVFVSYSHDDATWVQDFLMPRLESGKLSVCIDYKDFGLGLPALENMSRAVQNSRKVVLVLTPSWIASEWTDYESLLAQTMDPAGLRQKTIPLMLTNCTLPLRLRLFTYADFREPSRWEAEIRRLVRHLSQP